MGVLHGMGRYHLAIPMNLEELVDKESIARIIDVLVDGMNLDELGFEISGSKRTGRPAYSTPDLLKLYLYGYETGIRSSRKLEREVKRNIELMWLLKGLCPDHKTIAEFRRQNPDALVKAFHYFVGVIDGFGLIGKQLIAVDGTKIKASNNRKRNLNKKKLADKVKHLDEKIHGYLEALKTCDSQEEQKDNREILASLSERKAAYEALQKQLEESGENEISLVDPDARLMGNNRSGVDVSYNVQSAVDAENHIVVDFEITQNPADHGQLSVMAGRVKERFDLETITVLADKGYANGADLTRCKEQDIVTIVSRQDNSHKAPDPAFDSDKFTYDPEQDAFICPAGEVLNHKTKGKDRYRYFNRKACKSCPLREKCTTGTYRTASQSFYDDIFAENDQRLQENMDTYKLRQQIVEHPFGTIKEPMNCRQFSVRTQKKVRGEGAMMFMCYNLKRLVNIMGFDKLMEGLRALLSYLFCRLNNFFVLSRFKRHLRAIGLGF